MPYEDPAPNVASAAELANAPVRGRDGEPIGMVEDVMIDTDSGEVAYAVVNLVGAGKPPAQLTAVLWPALKRNSTGFILAEDPEKLRAAPGFERDQWPDFTSDEVKRRIDGYWGVDPHVDHRG